MADAPDLELLEMKSREELVEIAAAAGIPIPPRSRKPGIINAIRGFSVSERSVVSDGSVAPDGSAVQNSTADVAAARPTKNIRIARTLTLPRPDGGFANSANDALKPSMDDSPERPNERTTSHVNSNGSSVNNSASDDPSGGNSAEDGSTGSDADIAGEGNRRSRRRGRERDEQFQGEAAPCDGLLDLREEGYGFLRTNGLLPSPDDVYVAARHVRHFDLRRGDHVTGTSRPAARSEKNPALLRLDTVNGVEVADDAVEPRPLFEDIAAVHPATPLPLANSTNGVANSANDATTVPAEMLAILASLDSIAPVGRGQRGLLVAPPCANVTALVEAVSAAIAANHSDVHLIVLLVDERPEQITELSRRLETAGEVVASAFDRPADEHVVVAELTVERAKRMAEEGQDVVIVFDGLTRLARAHRRIVNFRQSQVTSDPAAIAASKSLFGAARNLETAGSITMLATAAAGTGVDFDMLALDEFISAANLTWKLLEDSSNQDRVGEGNQLVWLHESGCTSSGNHLNPPE